MVCTGFCWISAFKVSVSEYCSLLPRTPLETFPLRIDDINRVINVNSLCHRSVNPIKIHQIELCSVSGVFSECKFFVTKSQKMEIFFQTRNAMNVGLTYFGSRGFCGANGVSFS